MNYLAIACLAVALLVLVLLAASIVRDLLSGEGQGKIAQVLLEVTNDGSKPGKPSVSRLQMLIWNFMVAFAFLYVLATSGGTGAELKTALDNLLTNNVLILLGISNGTYVLGKVSKQGDKQQHEGLPTPVRKMPPTANVQGVVAQTYSSAGKPVG